MLGWFQESCDPFSPTSQPRKLGNYVSYSIEVSGVEDIMAGIVFSKVHNAMVVIKNTGHEYFVSVIP